MNPLSLTINAPNLGTLEVASKQMKPAAVEVTALGEVELKLKPLEAGFKKKLKP